jgi:glycosyltransferase involved in cell wall biosynthesis
MRKRVHQLLAALSYGDAVSNEALVIRAHLRRAGFESDIFAEHTHPRMVGEARPLSDYPRVSGPDTVCLFHFSIGSAAGRLIYHAPDRLVTRYHNITPAPFFLGFNHHLTGLCYHGRRELAVYAGRTELALGVSEFNRRELEAAGFPRTGVLPMVLDFASLDCPPSPAVLELYGDARTNVLFVGRIMPNKRIEDLIRAFALFERRFKKSRLILVGDERGLEHYFDRLSEMVAALGLKDVIFTGHVDHDDLMAYYALADLFVCVSEHEGFCVPLVEAMNFGIPVLAYDAGAVGETLLGAGVLLKEKRPEILAEVMGQILADPSLHRSILASQARRIGELRKTDYGALLQERLARVLDPPA